MIPAALAAAILAQAYYTPAEAQTLFSQATDAYSREDYAAAKEGYQKLLEHGYGGPDVLFNLGTTYLAQGDLGQAVLFLERARRLDPRASDVDINLAMARSKQMDQVVGGQGEEPFIQRLVVATPEQVVAWTFLGAWTLGFTCLFLFRLLRPGRRTWVALVAITCLIAGVPSGLLLGAHAYVRETVAEAVVLAKTLPARELPRESSKVAFELHAGLKVRIQEASGRFVRIRLPNGLEGWAEREGLADL